MPNGEEFQKKLSEWEEKTQLYQERAETSQTQLVAYEKELERSTAEQMRKRFAELAPSPMKQILSLPTWAGVLPSIGPMLSASAVSNIKDRAATTMDEMEYNDFFARLYSEVPYAISSGDVTSADEILTMLRPPANISIDELNEVRDTINGMVTAIAKPSGIIPAAELEFPELVAPAPVSKVPITVHQLSVEDIVRSLKTPVTPEGAMTPAEWEEYLKSKGFDDEDIDKEQQILAEQIITSWEDRNNQIEASRAAIAEMPDYKLIDALKLMAVSPGLAAMEAVTSYRERVSMPLAGHLWKNIWPDLEAEYQRYKIANPDVPDWVAMGHAFEDWDSPGEGVAEWMFKYILLEGIADPLSYVGWGIIGKFARPFGKFGKWVGGVDRGIGMVLNLPFDYAKKVWGKFPKTTTQRGLLVRAKTEQFLQSYLEKATGKSLADMTMPNLEKAAARAMKFAFENPHIETDMALAGRAMLMHAPIDEAVTKAWAVRLKSTLRPEDITATTVQAVDDVFEDFFWKSTNKLVTADEAAGRLLAIFHNAGDDTLRPVAKRLLDERSATILLGSMAFTGAKNPIKAIMVVGYRNYKTHIVAEEAAATLARKTAGSHTVLLYGVELKLQGIWRNVIDKWIVKPFAEAYLTFGMYGPMNMLEDYFRSALGGVYPRRMNNTRFMRKWAGISYDPNYRIDALSEMLGYFRTRPEGELNNWILQLGGLAKGFGDRTYGVLVKAPGHVGMEVRRNFVDGRAMQILSDIGGDSVLAIRSIGKRRLPEVVTSKSLKKEMQMTLDDLLTSGSPDVVRGGKDYFTRAKIIRNEVDTILKEHPDLPRSVRDYVMKSYDDNVLLRTADDIQRVVKEADDILMDDFLRGTERATTEYKQLADFLVALEVKNPQEMAQAIQSVYKMSEIYGALPDQIIARATVRNRGLPRAERLSSFDAEFDRIYQFLDSAGADIHRVIDKLGAVKMGTAGYGRARTRVFDIMATKQEFALEFRAQNMATRHEIFAGISKKEMTGEFWDDFYLRMNSEFKTFTIRQAELDGTLVKAMEQMNVAAGAKIKTRPPIVVRDRPLAPNDIALLLGVRGDDISRALLDVLTVQGDKNFFVAYVRAMTKTGDVGFSKKAIGEVYDQIAYSLRVAPESMSWISGKRLEMEAVRKEMHSLYNSKLLPEDEIASIGKWFDEAGDALEELMYQPTRLMRKGYRAGKLEPTTGASATEGEGLYIARTREMAEGFVEKDIVDSAKVKVVKFREPKNPLEADYAHMVLWDDEELLRPILAADGEWVKIQKQAAKNVGLTEEDWHSKIPALNKEISRLAREAGYDAIDADDWMVLLDESLWKNIPPSPPPVPKPEYANYDELRQQAMDEATKWYYQEFTDYTNANAFDSMMKTIYPYWTYESQRWFWLPRTFVRHPGLFTSFERWQDNTDYGYLHIPNTSIDVNFARGTVFGAMTTRLVRRDYPEYYDSLGAASGLIEFNDYLSRFGFYPGAHINIPLSMMGGLEQQMGETLPSIWKTPLNALIALLPESENVKWLTEHIFSDRFREYMTILEVNKRGYNGTHIWTKIRENLPITDEEQAVWDDARQEAAFYGVGFEQFGLFRLRSDEQYEAYEKSAAVIEEMTGYTVEQQEWLRRHGYKVWDMVGGLSSTNQAILQEMDTYKWIGSRTPLLPSRQQEELRRLELDWDDVMSYVESTKSEKLQLQQEFLSGKLGPKDYSNRLQSLYQNQRTYIDNKMLENPLMTLEGRKEYQKKYDIVAPVMHPSKELSNLYFSIELNTKAVDPNTGEIFTDWDTFFAQRMAIEAAMPEDISAEWEATLSKNTTRVEEVRRDVSNKYFRKYYDVWEATLAAFPENEQLLINEYLYLERTGQDLDRQSTIEEIVSSKTELQLISSFRSEVSDNRAALRFANPHLDAWLFYWGKVTSFKTPQAEALYQQIAIDTGRKI